MKNLFDNAIYEAEIQALFLRFPSVQTSNFNEAYKPGLDRMHKFDEALGFPSRNFRTIHVAGTNGKGSVANMLSAVFTGTGLKAGLYTSPHILDFRERMRIGSDLVPKEYVYDFILEWKPVFEKLSLSFFEITTGMAFKWFSDMKVDVAVIEVGLGGRLDSTNIIVPELSIVTGIGLDHCEYLGDTLAKIAFEKAGIFKKDRPALVGEISNETAPVFVEKAREVGCDLYFAQEMEPRYAKYQGNILENMDLRGKYQSKNLLTVISAIDLLRGSFPNLANEEQVVESLIHTASIMDFHGRWEMLCKEPMVICDIGHNAHALINNFSQLSDMMQGGVYSSLIIVYAIMADKDLDAIMPLMPSDATYIFATPSTKRALPAGKILERYSEYRKDKGLGTDFLYVRESMKDAVDFALELAKGKHSLVYIGGSTFAVSEAVPMFEK